MSGAHGARHGHSSSLIIAGPIRGDTNHDTTCTMSPARGFTAHHVEATSENQTAPRPSLTKDEASQTKDKDTKQMKERFAKLLLGEDMSGTGKGVCSAVALSNAITNLAASVFSEQRRLEPLPPEQKARWKKEIKWLLSVSDYIVQFSPCQQQNKDGLCVEVMTTKQRTDLQMNIPALRKLDTMLTDCLDDFKDQNEFYYVSRDDDKTKKGAKKKDEKWWLPMVKVPSNGLSEVTRKWIQFQKDSVNQVLKAAMAINAEVLSDMEIPENYIESLPKNGRSSLGDFIYKSITVDFFDPEQFLAATDLSSEHKIIDLKNKLEASIVIWNRKMTNKDNKSPWGSAISLEKRELFEERAETILMILKQRFPGSSQSALDISKIQYNKDVGHALLESYSRVIESVAHKVLSRIEDVLDADSVAQNPTRKPNKTSPPIQVATSIKFPNAREEIERLNSISVPTSMTLLDFMGWTLDRGENQEKTNSDEVVEDVVEPKSPLMVKLKVETPRKVTYIERLENLGGTRSPRARH